MERLVFALIGIATVLCYAGLGLAPFACALVEGGAAWWRRVVAVLGSYAILAAVAGVAAYAVLPADYTLFHRRTLHPMASSLGEIHAVDLERMPHPGAFSPEYATARREEIRRERWAFARDWATVTGGGGAVLALGLVAWRGVQRRGRR